MLGLSVASHRNSVAKQRRLVLNGGDVINGKLNLYTNIVCFVDYISAELNGTL